MDLTKRIEAADQALKTGQEQTALVHATLAVVEALRNITRALYDHD